MVPAVDRVEKWTEGKIQFPLPYHMHY